MQTNQRRLIGIYKADGGIIGEVSYFLGHLVGVRNCSLCDVTHSPFKKKAEFKKFQARLLENHQLEVSLVHMNERSESELAASKGREPCVLLQHEDGSMSMFLDYEELAAAKGSVRSFEKLLESRIAIYL